MNKSNINLKPMGIIEAAIYFLSFSAFIAIGIHIVLPFLTSKGVPLFIPYYISFTIPLLLGLTLSVVFYKYERREELHQITFSQRFMLKKLSLKDWLWAIALILFWLISFVLIKGITKDILSTPEYLLYAKDTWFNLTIEDNYPVAIWLIAFLALNILGEELFWRGYMMPRLEKKFGKELGW